MSPIDSNHPQSDRSIYDTVLVSLGFIVFFGITFQAHGHVDKHPCRTSCVAPLFLDDIGGSDSRFWLRKKACLDPIVAPSLLIHTCLQRTEGSAMRTGALSILRSLQLYLRIDQLNPSCLG